MTPLHTDRRQFLLGAAACLAAPAFAQGAAWPSPSHTVRIIVPQPAGGYTDQIGRMVQQNLAGAFGTTFIVDNKAGANMRIGVQDLARSAPDGYTFGVVVAGFVINTSFYAKLPYDPVKDLMGVSLIGVSPLVAAVSNNAPFRTASEVIDYARKNPGKVSFGSTGTGSASHLAAELWMARTGVTMTHVPYKGSVPGVMDLIGGQVQLFFDAPSGLVPYAKDGKVRLIGVASDKRLPMIPEVPTFVEQGFPDFIASTWAGLLAPAGTPKDIVRRVSGQIAKFVRTDELRAKFDAMGTVPAGSTPEEFDAFMAQETTKWRDVLRAANVKQE
ncbi:MAG: tripartite tricarboxylate transporter substrate binding protein [Bordetella sp.]|nr:tripartite tricarboxylate transporter substrate binding protein [Bordetella sp.]